MLRLTGLIRVSPCNGTLLSKIVVPAGPMGRFLSGSGESTPGGVAWEFDWQTGLERPAGEPHNGAHPNGNGPATWLNGHGEHRADPFGDTVVTAGHAERGDWPPRAQGE